MLTLSRALVTRPTQRFISGTKMKMGFFDFLTPSKKSASASHILLKGPDADKRLLGMKAKLDASKNLKMDFSSMAAANSACPSARKGGALGTFRPGQMVPAFDKVVFSQAVGVVHGPVKTPFGSHLILINEREG